VIPGIGIGPRPSSRRATGSGQPSPHQPDLRRVGPEDHSAVLRLLSDRRDELSGERRRAVNRLHRLLRDLRPGGAPTELSAARASELLGHIRPGAVVDLERKAMARALVADLRRIDRALVENRARCAVAVAASDTTLTDIVGISDVLAAKILGHVRDITRFGSADRFASYSGTAPIEVSSGEVTATDFRAVVTARSTTRFTSRRGSRRCIRAPGATTTDASSPSTSPLARRSAA
jgi:transposase